MYWCECWVHDPDDADGDVPRTLQSTYPHSAQLAKLTYCATVLSTVPRALWIIVEDAAEITAAVAQMLETFASKRSLRYVHVAHGPTHVQYTSAHRRNT